MKLLCFRPDREYRSWQTKPLPLKRKVFSAGIQIKGQVKTVAYGLGRPAHRMSLL